MDPLAPLALARTKADEIAATIPEITSGSNRISTSRTLKSSSGKPSQNTAGEWASVGLEDEDMALQAALYASVLGQPESTPASASIVPELARPGTSRRDSEEWDIRGASSVFGGSSSRSRAPPASTALARFDEEQMGGLDEPIVGEESDHMIASILSNERGFEDLSPVIPPSRTRPRRQRQEDEEEEEMVRRAIEASQREEREDEVDDVDMIHFDEEEHHGFLDDEDEERELQRLLAQRQRDRQPLLPELPIIPALDPNPTFDRFGAPALGANAAHLSRTYDDEDTELQAALKASLEAAPVDFSVPPPPKPATRAVSNDIDTAAAVSTSASTSKRVEDEEEDEEEEEETEEEPEPPKQPTAEEMRKARLARFGG
jgi:ataxin-3